MKIKNQRKSVLITLLAVAAVAGLMLLIAVLGSDGYANSDGSPLLFTENILIY